MSNNHHSKKEQNKKKKLDPNNEKDRSEMVRKAVDRAVNEYGEALEKLSRE
jgi:hypothetical protein